MERTMQSMKSILRCLVFTVCCLLAINPIVTLAQQETFELQSQSAVEQTLSTLRKFSQLRTSLEAQIEEVEQQLNASDFDSEKQELKKELTDLENDLDSLKENFVEIASGISFAAVSNDVQQKFNLQSEMLALMEPLVREMKHMTSDVRKKSDLREIIAFYKLQIPKAESAIENVAILLQQAENEAVAANLQDTLASWKRQHDKMESQLQAVELQLNRMESEEISFTESSQNYLKRFFQERGLYLTQALGVVFAILMLSRLLRAMLVRIVPGYRREPRSFRIRLVDLLHRLLTIVLMIIGPMVIFYIAEDWVLFSLGILLLLGAAWTLRTAVPRYWQQFLIYLNIGSVRESERIVYDGLPWKVKKIDLFTQLYNPVSGIRQRIAIENLVDLQSRPALPHEPWFPCSVGDWVILSDGVRGEVLGISQELIELQQRGGAHKTYLTPDFLSLSPLNLSKTFRIKEVLGVSYDLQASSTGSMLQTLKTHLIKQIRNEGYESDLMQLNVEFQAANTSSLDLVVIADFKGAQAPFYNRLRRAIQRWCVDCCSENHWEIPFTQVTMHIPHKT